MRLPRRPRLRCRRVLRRGGARLVAVAVTTAVMSSALAQASPPADAAQITAAVGQQAVTLASQEAGDPYVFGASGPNAFDCSGLVQYVYGRLGVSLPRTTREQYAVMTPVPKAELRLGDVVFFYDSAGWIYHDAIYAGNGQMWAAPKTGDQVKLQAVFGTAWYAGRPTVGSSIATAAAQTAAVERYVTKVYEDLFRRAPDGPGLLMWTSALRTGTPYGEVANSLTASPEYRSRLIAASYGRYLGRAPDSGGLATWLDQMARGMHIEQMGAGFISSKEFYLQAGSDDRQWIRNLYTSVLRRSAAETEVDHWQRQLRQGAVHRDVARGFLYSTEHLTSVVDGYYRDLLGRSIDASGRTTWVGAIQRGSRDEQIIASLVSSAEYRLET